MTLLGLPQLTPAGVRDCRCELTVYSVPPPYISNLQMIEETLDIPFYTYLTVDIPQKAH